MITLYFGHFKENALNEMLKHSFRQVHNVDAELLTLSVALKETSSDFVFSDALLKILSLTGQKVSYMLEGLFWTGPIVPSFCFV